MSVMGFFEPAGVRLKIEHGLGQGIGVQGAVLEGRMNVRDALAFDSARARARLTAAVYSVPAGSRTSPWTEADTDAFWAGRDSVFG